MITINLKPGAKRQAQKGRSFAAVTDQFKGLGESVKEPWRLAAIAAWVVVALGLGFMYLRTGSQLSSLEPQVLAKRAEFRRYQGFLAQKRREEKVRDSILSQIGVISAVDQDRYVWPHILSEIGGALPDFTWLSSVSNVAVTPDPNDSSAAPVQVRIVGFTNDLQNYTAFLRRLEESPWLSNVEPKEAKTAVVGNRAMTQFTIQASFSRADSSMIRTVPILKSVVR